MSARIKRPVLRYHGGKHRLAPWIVSRMPAHRVYVEPFCGAASVLMAKPRSYAEVIGDIDGEIVSLFRVLRDPAEARELQRLLELTPFARAEFEESYTPATDPIEQARRTIIRSFMGFGSASACGNRTGFRADSNKSGATPARDWANYADVLPSFCHRLRGVVVEHCDAAALLRSHDGPQTLIYADPPYVMSTRRMRNPWCHKGYRYEMTDDDHRELASVLRAAEGMVLLSGYPSDLYDRELYADWHRETRAAHADGARDRTEVLWFNAAASAALPQGVLGL